MPLRLNHPNLYLTTLLHGLLYLLIGVNYFLVPTALLPFNISHQFGGLVFGLVGLGWLVTANIAGISGYRRIFYIVGMTLYFIFAAGYLKSFLNNEGARSFGGVIFYGLLGLLTVPIILEPPINPATQRRSHGGK